MAQAGRAAFRAASVAVALGMAGATTTAQTLVSTGYQGMRLSNEDAGAHSFPAGLFVDVSAPATPGWSLVGALDWGRNEIERNAGTAFLVARTSLLVTGGGARRHLTPRQPVDAYLQLTAGVARISTNGWLDGLHLLAESNSVFALTPSFGVATRSRGRVGSKAEVGYRRVFSGLTLLADTDGTRALVGVTLRP